MPICTLSEAEGRLEVTQGCMEVTNAANQSLCEGFALRHLAETPSSVFSGGPFIGWQVLCKFYPD